MGFTIYRNPDLALLGQCLSLQSRELFYPVAVFLELSVVLESIITLLFMKLFPPVSGMVYFPIAHPSAPRHRLPLLACILVSVSPGLSGPAFLYTAWLRGLSATTAAP